MHFVLRHEEESRNFRLHVEQLQDLHHPNFFTVRAAFRWNEENCIVMEKFER
jgi:hypothetical protein